MKKLLQFWPLVLAAVAIIVWLVRLEARANQAPTQVETAVTAQKLDDLKEQVNRVEQKVDTLLRRGK